MGSEIGTVSILIFILIGINFLIIDFAKYGVGGIRCPNMIYDEDVVDGNYSLVANSSVEWEDVSDIVRGRCQGLPIWFVLLIELPLLGSLLYVIISLLPFT